MRWIGGVLFGLFLAQSAQACGPDSDCPVGDRFYRIAMPDGVGAETEVPVIIFAHGYKGTAQGVMRNGSLRRLASDLGAALIAPKSVGPGWNLPKGPRTFDSDGSAEFNYFEGIVNDAAARFPLDTDRIMVTGFSGGGMMVWNLACARPDTYAGFAPIAGTFWYEPPETCAKPASSIVHIHGDADKTVPLLGRKIAATKQGEVPQALEMYGRIGEFGAPQPKSYEGLDCQERTNATGAILEFCMFSGGHSFRTEHVRHAWERLQHAGKL